MRVDIQSKAFAGKPVLGAITFDVPQGAFVSICGPSGIGKDDYTWCLQNVHLVPRTWERPPSKAPSTGLRA